MDYERLAEALLVVLLGIVLVGGGVISAVGIIAITILYPIMLLVWAAIVLATVLVYKFVM